VVVVVLAAHEQKLGWRLRMATGRGGAGEAPFVPALIPEIQSPLSPELQMGVKVSPVPDPVGSPIPVGAPPAPRVTAK
jgi:hypothetical protein